MLLAASIRLIAVWRLPIDFDEDDYLHAAQVYAAGLRAGDLTVLLDENPVPEHPPLAKIAYAIALVALPSAPEIRVPVTRSPPAAELPQPQLAVARGVAASLGTLSVAALAISDPLAALLLAGHASQVRYTSQVMAEALPTFLSVLAVLAYLRSARRDLRWLLASAALTGLAVAAKYPYGLVGVAIVLDWLYAERKRVRAGWVSAWLAGAVLAFFAAAPYLWPDPAGRLGSSLLFHPAYTQSESVQTRDFPFFQPLVYLLTGPPGGTGGWPALLDALILVLGLAGLRAAWRAHRVFVIWLLVGLAFLLVWPTKWPQYVLLVTVPLTVVAADGVRALLRRPRYGRE